MVPLRKLLTENSSLVGIENTISSSVSALHSCLPLKLALSLDLDSLGLEFKVRILGLVLELESENLGLQLGRHNYG